MLQCDELVQCFVIELLIRNRRFDQRVERGLANFGGPFRDVACMPVQRAFGAREFCQALGGGAFVFFGGDYLRLRGGLPDRRLHALFQILHQRAFVAGGDGLQRRRLRKIDAHLVRRPSGPIISRAS